MQKNVSADFHRFHVWTVTVLWASLVDNAASSIPVATDDWCIFCKEKPSKLEYRYEFFIVRILCI